MLPVVRRAPDPWVMHATATRLGLTCDELVARTWGGAQAPVYAAHLPGLDVLAGETLALVGAGSDALLDRLHDALAGCVHVDGAVAAAGGTLRIQAVQAVRVGLRALAVSDPFGVGQAGRELAVADLAGLGGLGLTTVVAVDDVTLAALFADRVVVVDGGEVQVAYPVIAPTPRSPGEVAAVAHRVGTRLPVQARG